MTTDGHTTVLRRINTQSTRFEQEGWRDEEDGALAHSLHVDLGVWVLLGCPDAVTVTIEPGDRLNDD